MDRPSLIRLLAAFVLFVAGLLLLGRAHAATDYQILWSDAGTYVQDVEGVCKKQSGATGVGISYSHVVTPWGGLETQAQCFRKRVNQSTGATTIEGYYNPTGTRRCPDGTTATSDAVNGGFKCPDPTGTCAAKAGKGAGEMGWAGRAEEKYICLPEGCTGHYYSSWGTDTYNAATGQTEFWSYGNGTYTGRSCNPASDGTGTTDSNDKPESPPCPKGQTALQLSDRVICYPAEEVPGVETGSKDTSTDTKTNNDGSTTQTTTSKETTCNGGTCTTTTTVTTVSTTAGGTPTVMANKTVTTMSQGAFCEANKADSQCQGSGSGSGGSGSGGSWFGDCTAGFTCEGDAVQCAMAKEQHTRMCKLIDTPNVWSDKGMAAMNDEAKPADHPGNSANVETRDLSAGFDQTPLIGSGCPADISIGGVTMPISKVCTPASWLGNFLVAFTALACLGIVFVRS